MSSKSIAPIFKKLAILRDPLPWPYLKGPNVLIPQIRCRSVFSTSILFILLENKIMIFSIIIVEILILRDLLWSPCWIGQPLDPLARVWAFRDPPRPRVSILTACFLVMSKSSTYTQRYYLNMRMMFRSVRFSCSRRWEPLFSWWTLRSDPL